MNDTNKGAYSRRSGVSNCQNFPPKTLSSERVKIPEFKGKLGPDEFLDWLAQVERIFNIQEVEEGKKCKLVILKLKGYASTWWQNLETSRLREGKEKIRNWEKMKKKFRERFVPKTYLQDSYAKFHNLEQGKLSVEEYTHRFEELSVKCGLQEPESQTVVRHLNGLNRKIAKKVDLLPYSSFNEVCVLAHKIEGQRKNKVKEDPTHEGSYSTPHLSLRFETPRKEVQKHPMTNSVPKIGNARAEPKRCFKCQGVGHLSFECHNRRVATTQEVKRASFGKKKEEPAELEEVEVVADEGELLLIRTLHTDESMEEETQRECLFHTRCTIQGKIANLIIDGGSCTNVASNSLVEKLQLPTRPHPRPYNIQWLNHEQGNTVNSQVLISLSIGKNYQDRIWCDVILMDVCHVLLGRPWLYERRVIHDGFRNTYTLEKGGKKIHLLPMLPSQIQPKGGKRKNKVLTLTRDLHSARKCETKRTKDNGGKEVFIAQRGWFGREYVHLNPLNLRANSLQQWEDDVHGPGLCKTISRDITYYVSWALSRPKSWSNKTLPWTASTKQVTMK